MIKKKIVFIVNPISGINKKDSIIELVKKNVNPNLYDFEIETTEYAGHGYEIALQKVKEKAFAVIAVGGDGTVNEIGKALVHTETALGIIPCGSGNGLARHLHIPMSPDQAIDIINNGDTDVIDYGKINEHLFFCTCGVGFDAFVSLKFSESGKRGPLSYVEKALTESISYTPETYELEIDGSKVRSKAFVIACGNAAQYGNNAYIAPRASLHDGLLDVTILQPFTFLDVPSLAFQLFNKTIDENSHIKTFRCNSVKIIREKEGVAHFDGDPILLGKDLDIKIIPQGLKVLISESAENNYTLLQKAQHAMNNGLKQFNDNVFEGIEKLNKDLGKAFNRFKTSRNNSEEKM